MAFQATGNSNSGGGTAASFTPSMAGSFTGSNNVALVVVVVNSTTATVTPPAGWGTLYTYAGTGAMAGHKLWAFWKREAALTTLNWGAFTISGSQSHFWTISGWKDTYPNVMANEAITASSVNLTTSGGNRITRASGTFSAGWTVGAWIRLEGFTGGLVGVNGDYRISAVDSGAHLYVEFQTAAGANPVWAGGTQTTGTIKFLPDYDRNPVGIPSTPVIAVTEEYHRNSGEATLNYPAVTAQGHSIIQVGYIANNTAITSSGSPSNGTPNLGPVWNLYPTSNTGGGYRGALWYGSQEMLAPGDVGARTQTCAYTTGGASFSFTFMVHHDLPPRAASSLTAACVVVTMPTAEFDMSPAVPRAGQTVTFTDASNGAPTSWLWSFGDGSTSTSQNPTHVYQNPGLYRVVLVCTNATGDSIPFSMIVTVEPAASSVNFILPPVADFSYTPEYGGRTAGELEITFADRSLGTGLTWRWEFGDGVTSTSQNPTHAYTNEGLWQVVLTVTDAAGATSRCVRQVYVQDGATILNSPPVVQIDSLSTNRDYFPLSIDFVASTDMDVEYIGWDFGDGNTAEGATATHEYAEAGTYVVTVTASNQQGVSYASIEVQVLGDIKYSIAPNQFNVVLFTWRNEGHAYDENWNFVSAFGHGPDSDAGKMNTPKNMAACLPLIL